MARILVFAIDWVPGPEDVASGGGLRSLQVIEALRAGGHEVRYAVPGRSRAVQAMKISAPERLRGVELFEREDQFTLVRAWRPNWWSGFGRAPARCPMVWAKWRSFAT